MSTRQIYTINGDRVNASRLEYLFLKLCYGQGLTPEEYDEYKKASKP
jgi:hypothetical protein